VKLVDSLLNPSKHVDFSLRSRKNRKSNYAESQRRALCARAKVLLHDTS